MIAKYLEKNYKEMYEKKISLEHLYQKNELLLKENIQFICTLEGSLDKNYESFSPRPINHEYYEKIELIKKEQLSIEKKGEDLKKKISDVNAHLAELESILKIARESEKLIVNKEVLVKEEELFRRKILETQEVERQRIARDLHDSIIQSLTNMIHKIELTTKIMDMDPIRCKLELQAMSQVVKKSIDDMRQIIYNLRPMSFDDMGLHVTLEREIEKLRSVGEVQVEYKISGIVQKLAPITSLTILRIVQEAFNNIIKHANAQHIKIFIYYESQRIKLKIEDDGCGFNIDNVQSSENSEDSGFGISMMKERVYLLSGKINIESVLDKGTKIIVKIPIYKKENLKC